jgi:hypothetical protein
MSKQRDWIGDQSARRIGEVWNQEDHDALMENLRNADRLAAQLVERARQSVAAEGPVRKRGVEHSALLNVRGVPIRRTVEDKLEKMGIYARPALSVEYQPLARRFVIRGVESGGAVKEAGRYVAYADEEGRPLAWLHPVDSIARNGIHAVVIAEQLVRIEMLRAGCTYDLSITRHRLQPLGERVRPRLVAEEIFLGRGGYLGLELWGKDNKLAGGVTPQFFTRAGEDLAVPAVFASAAKSVTRGVSCLGCGHRHYSVPAFPCTESTSEPARFSTPSPI